MYSPVGSGGVLTLSAVRPQVELNINDDVQDIYPPSGFAPLNTI